MYAIRSYYDLLRGQGLGRKDEVALVLAVLVVHDQHAEALAKGLQRSFDPRFRVAVRGKQGLRITSYNVCYTKLLRISWFVSVIRCFNTIKVVLQNGIFYGTF